MIQQGQELEVRQKSLENRLWKDAHIGLKERAWNIWKNVKDNINGLWPLCAGLGLFAFATWAGFRLYHHTQDTKTYQQAFNFISLLADVAKNSKEFNLSLNIQPEVLDIVTDLVKQGAEKIYENHAQRIVQNIQENRQLFQGEGVSALEQKLSYLVNLKDSLKEIAESGRELFYGISTVVGGLFGVFGTLVGGRLVSEEVMFEDNLYDRKQLSRKLKGRLPEIREKLSDNPNAKTIYDFIDVIAETGTNGDRLLEVVELLKERKDERDKPLLEILSTQPSRYSDSYRIMDALSSFEGELRREEKQESKVSEQQISNETLEVQKLKSNLYKPIRFSKIYLGLIGKGWSAEDISRIISKVDSLTDSREFFFENLEGQDSNSTLFSNVLSFYQSFNRLNPEKRKAIAKYLFEKGNRKFSSQLELCDVSDDVVMKYIDSLDEVPGVGTKGQVKALVKLNNVVRHMKILGQDIDISGIARVLRYERPQFDSSALEVAQFLQKHPRLPADKIFGALAEFYSLTDGNQFRSNWIQKEKNLLKERESQTLEGLFDEKGERKFMEELNRKISLARFEAFNRMIDDLYYAPLDRVLGERVDRTNIEMTDDIINIISGYHRTDYKEELQPLVRDILKIHLTHLEGVRTYIDGLEGNKNLEQRVGEQTLGVWRQGHSYTYDVHIDREIKKKLQEQVRHEYNEFMKCAFGLGWEDKESKKQKDQLKQAEAIFKIISKDETEDEKKYLLIEAKNHLTNLKQKTGIVKSGSGRVTFYDSKNPIEIMQMGIVSNSCTDITKGANSYASIVNAIDNNKKVVYMVDDAGNKIGRTLAVLTNQGVVTFRKYDNSNLNTNEAWVDYFHSYASQVGIPLIVPTTYIESGMQKVLEDKGVRKTSVKAKMQKAVSSHWYADALGERVDIGDDGYTMKFDAYILNPKTLTSH